MFVVQLLTGYFKSIMFNRFNIILALLFVSYGTVAQTSFSSLEDLWKYADSHNITIRNAGYELDKVLYAKKQSYMAFLPQVTANGSFTDNTSLQTTLIPAEIFGGPSGTYRPVQFGQKYIYTAGFSAQMDIVNLQTWYNVSVARETEEMNRASISNTKKTTYQQIATQYYAYLLNKEAVRLATQSELIADSVLNSVANKFKEGTVNQANLDIAKLNKERAGLTLITAQYQMQTIKNSLKGMLDLSVTDSLAIDGTLQFDITTNIPGTFTEDPAVRLANYQSQLSLNMYRASNANFFPTLTVQYSNTTQQNDNKFEPFQGGPSWYPARYWSLRASWTLFSGGTRWAQSQKNRINYYESKMQFENAQKQSEINDENLRLSFRKSSLLLAKAQNIMNLSYDNYRHISNRYYEGVAALDERLNAFTDYINFQNQYLNSLSDMLIQLYLIKIRQQSF
jgi:outer membrane protein